MGWTHDTLAVVQWALLVLGPNERLERIERYLIGRMGRDA